MDSGSSNKFRGQSKSSYKLELLEQLMKPQKHQEQMPAIEEQLKKKKKKKSLHL
jgi:hypothetical protein